MIFNCFNRLDLEFVSKSMTFQMFFGGVLEENSIFIYPCHVLDNPEGKQGKGLVRVEYVNGPLPGTSLF